MEVDNDEEVAVNNSKAENIDFTDDSVIWERDVVVCNSLTNSNMYCVTYPSSKQDAWKPEKYPSAKFKKNVRLLQMRMIPDTTTGSYDKKKAEKMLEGASDGDGSQQQNYGSINSLRKNDEVYEGRSFTNEHPLIESIGFMKNGQFYIHPLSGNFEMHRVVNVTSGKKRKGIKTEDEEMMSAEDDEDEPNTSTGNVRVKFSRPETERQKARRESSALFREKKIANDLWIDMKVYLRNDEKVNEKIEMLSRTGIKTEEGQPNRHQKEVMEIRELINKAIICSIKEELVIESGKEHMLSKQRIDELAPHLQIKAHMVKAHVMRTSEMMKLIEKSEMSFDEVVQNLQHCACLVNGVWVLQSDLLFNNLPPAHATVAGKTDVYRSELWRNARDLALCLIDGGHKVTRLTLITCFQVSERDAEEILSTFGVRDEVNRTWKLRIEKDEKFLDSPEAQKYVIEEKRKWVDRFGELEKLINSKPELSPSKKK